MYDYFQVKTNGTPRKCWCIVFSCKKRLKISIFVYFAPCWPYQTSTFPQEVQEHVQRCGEAASNSRHGCVSAKRSGAAPQNVDKLRHTEKICREYTDYTDFIENIRKLRVGKIWNTQGVREGEVPSANGNCSARGERFEYIFFVILRSECLDTFSFLDLSSLSFFCKVSQGWQLSWQTEALCKVTMFLAVQDSSIGDLVTHSLSHSLTQTCFDFSNF